jgi:hypothetical protein
LPTIETPLPNGAPRNALGLGGIVGHEARKAKADGIARLLALLTDYTPLGAGAALEAAEFALEGSDRAMKVAAVRRLHALVRDPKSPAGVAARAAGLLLSRCGKRQKGRN